LRQVKSWCFLLFFLGEEITLMESKEIERINTIHRELGLYLKDMLQADLEMRRKVAALLKLVERTPQLKGDFQACLRETQQTSDKSPHKDSGNWETDGQPRSAWLGTANRLFAMLAEK